MIRFQTRLCVLGLSFCAAVGFAAAPTHLRVAIYSGTGAESDKTLALYRGVAACGHTPLAIVKSGIANGWLATNSFPVFLIPAGEGGEKCCADHFPDVDALGALAEAQIGRERRQRTSSAPGHQAGHRPVSGSLHKSL